MTLINKPIIIILLVMFLEFFSFNRIPILMDVMQLAAGCYLIAIFIGLWLRRKLVKSYFSFPINLFIFSVFFSATGAFYLHNQELYNTFIGNKAFYIYLLFPLLLVFNISEIEIIKIVKLFFFASVAIYCIDLLMLPDPPFQWRIHIRRGGVSIFFYGRAFLILGSFYFLYQYLLKFKFFNIIWYLVGSILIILLLSRMLVIGHLLGTTLILINHGKKRITYLIVTGFISSALSLTFYLLFQSTFDNLTDLSVNQYANVNSDTRYGAIPFFLYKYKTNNWNRIFGNGVPANSEYRDYYKKVADLERARIGDVGLFGVWIYFGIFAVVSWIMIFYKIYFVNGPPGSIFIKAYFVTVFLEAFTGFATHNPEYMPTTIIALYWFELIRRRNLVKTINEKRSVATRSVHI